MLVRAKFLVDAQGLNKVSGQPFSAGEIMERIMALRSATPSRARAS